MAVPEVGIALVVFLSVAFLRLGRLLDGLLHSLIPETHIRVVGVTPDAAGVRAPIRAGAGVNRPPHGAAQSCL